jgi:hypothetical protein
VALTQTAGNEALFSETELSGNGLPLHKHPVATDVAAPATPTPAWLGSGASTGYKQEADPATAGQVDESGHRIFLIDDELFTVVEGDLCLDEDELQLWQEAQQAQQALREATRLVESTGFGEAPILPTGAEQSQLVGMVQDGKYVRWAPGTVLTYCVLKNTFPRLEWYEEVVENMRLATEAWQMTCGVEFAYVSALDNSGSTRPSGALFPVRHINASGAFIAASFFPSDPATRRRVLIDPSYYTTRFDHVGVLRHELGHVIGWRHEHLRREAQPICPHEDTTGTINLTDYDPRSVMHYFCGGVGSRTLEITDIDRVGSQQVYGPPLSAFEFVEE